MYFCRSQLVSKKQKNNNVQTCMSRKRFCFFSRFEMRNWKTRERLPIFEIHFGAHTDIGNESHSNSKFETDLNFDSIFTNRFLPSAMNLRKSAILRGARYFSKDDRRFCPRRTVTSSRRRFGPSALSDSRASNTRTAKKKKKKRSHLATDDTAKERAKRFRAIAVSC